MGGLAFCIFKVVFCTLLEYGLLEGYVSYRSAAEDVLIHSALAKQSCILMIKSRPELKDGTTVKAAV